MVNNKPEYFHIVKFVLYGPVKIVMERFIHDLLKAPDGGRQNFKPTINCVCFLSVDFLSWTFLCLLKTLAGCLKAQETWSARFMRQGDSYKCEGLPGIDLILYA